MGDQFRAAREEGGEEQVERLASIMKSLYDQNINRFDEVAVEAVQRLTPEQQETFLSLVPEWSGTVDELIEAARELT